jgi:hypothetical protein
MRRVPAPRLFIVTRAPEGAHAGGDIISNWVLYHNFLPRAKNKSASRRASKLFRPRFWCYNKADISKGLGKEETGEAAPYVRTFLRQGDMVCLSCAASPRCSALF